MPAILALALVPPHTPGLPADTVALAAGPDGLFAVCLAPDLRLGPLPQPMSGLAAVALAGDRVLVGGSPHGVATLPAAQAAQGGTWRAAWLDYADEPALAMAPAPGDAGEIVLAATHGAGLLRSEDGGRTWRTGNTGLSDWRLLVVAWAPPAPAGAWPARAVAFTGGEAGLFRSPAGGLAWRAAAGVTGAVHAVAPAADFHTSGLVLAASAESEEAPTLLWRSSDGGRTFARVDAALDSCQTLAALPGGFLAGCADGLWHSPDGLAWTLLEGSPPGALCLLPLPNGVLAGTADGVTLVAHNHLVSF